MTSDNAQKHKQENIPYRRSLAAENILEEITNVNFFGYVQCDIEEALELRANFAKFPPIFKNASVSKNDIGDFMKTYAEEKGLMCQSRNMLISSLTLQNDTLITTLL